MATLVPKSHHGNQGTEYGFSQEPSMLNGAGLSILPVSSYTRNGTRALHTHTAERVFTNSLTAPGGSP